MTFFNTNVVQPRYAIYPFLVSLGTTVGSTAEEHRPSSRLTLKTPLQTVCVTVSSIYLTGRPQSGHTHAFRLWVPSRLIQVGGCTHLVRSTRRSLSPAIRHMDMMRTGSLDTSCPGSPQMNFSEIAVFEGWVRLLGGHISVQCKRRLKAKYLFIYSVAQTLSVASSCMECISTAGLSRDVRWTWKHIYIRRRTSGMWCMTGNPECKELTD